MVDSFGCYLRLWHLVYPSEFLVSQGLLPAKDSAVAESSSCPSDEWSAVFPMK